MYNFGQWNLHVNLLGGFLGKLLALTKRDRHSVVLPLFNFVFVLVCFVLLSVKTWWLEVK